MHKFHVLSSEAFREYKKEWDRLAARNGSISPVLHSDFFEVALQHFSHSRVKLLVAEESGSPIMIALVEPGKIGRWRTFSPAQLLVSSFVTSSEYIPSAFLAQLFRALSHPQYSFSFMYHDVLLQAGIDPSWKYCDSSIHATTISIDMNQTFSDYWAARKKKLRYNLKRYMKKINQKFSSIEICGVSDQEGISLAVDQYGGLESKGWKGREGTALHKDNTQGRFYSELLERFATRGAARVYQLKFDDMLVGSRLCIINDRSLVFLKTTFDENYSTYAAGRILLFLSLEKLFDEEDLDVAEFYTNADANQKQWGTHSREIRHLTAYSGKWSWTANSLKQRVVNQSIRKKSL